MLRQFELQPFKQPRQRRSSKATQLWRDFFGSKKKRDEARGPVQRLLLGDVINPRFALAI